MTAPRSGNGLPYQSFAERLVDALEALARRSIDVLDRSQITNIDPNRRASHMTFIGYAKWGWAPDDDSLVADRTALLTDLDEWLAQFQLLHRGAVPETTKRIDTNVTRLRTWLLRPRRNDRSVPSDIDKAKELAAESFTELRSLVELATTGDAEILAVADASALMREPGVENYATALGTNDFTAVIVPTVLGELDEQKDRGRTPDAREAATKAVRRIKGLRDRGDLLAGVAVAGKVTLRTEHREASADEVLDWLDPTVPDDRLLAAALDLQARHPAGTVVLVTGDLHLQTKAAAARMPFVDPFD